MLRDEKYSDRRSPSCRHLVLPVLSVVEDKDSIDTSDKGKSDNTVFVKVHSYLCCIDAVDVISICLRNERCRLWLSAHSFAGLQHAPCLNLSLNLVDCEWNRLATPFASFVFSEAGHTCQCDDQEA